MQPTGPTSTVASMVQVMVQGRFYVCAQPMKDVVTKQRRLSLAGRNLKISPDGLPSHYLNADVYQSDSLDHLYWKKNSYHNHPAIK